jgi:hypothetical protein
MPLKRFRTRILACLSLGIAIILVIVWLILQPPSIILHSIKSSSSQIFYKSQRSMVDCSIERGPTDSDMAL